MDYYKLNCLLCWYNIIDIKHFKKIPWQKSVQS